MRRHRPHHRPTRRTPLRALLIVVAVAAATPSGPAEAQTEAAITQTGWWTRRPAATAVGGGGFEVAEAPDDDVSVAALRIRVTRPLTRATLVMNESGGVRTDMASLRACVATGTWTPADPGPWAQRPTPNCAGGGIAVERSPTGGSWSANVLPILPAPGSTATLMIVPGPTSLPVDGFQVVFAGALLDADGASAGNGGAAPGGAGGTGGGTTATTGPTFGFGFGGTVDTTPDFGFPGAGAPDAGQPITTPPGTGVDELGGPTFEPPGAAADGGGADQPWRRLPLLVVLAAAAGAVVAFARKTMRDRGLLASR